MEYSREEQDDETMNQKQLLCVTIICENKIRKCSNSGECWVREELKYDALENLPKADEVSNMTLFLRSKKLSLFLTC